MDCIRNIMQFCSIPCQRFAVETAIISAWLSLSIGILASSCTPTTGTRIPSTAIDLKKFGTIGVINTKEQDFSVMLSRQEMTAGGAVLFGLLGAGIEVAARHSADMRLEEQFKPLVSNYHPEKVMNERLLHYLQSAKSFSSVVGVDAKKGLILKEKGLDGVLEVTIKEWGLRRCLGPSPETVQMGFTIYGRMFLKEDGSIVWERDELYLDGECHPWQDFRSREGLLKEVLLRTIDNLSGKIVNEILFP